MPVCVPRTPRTCSRALRKRPRCVREEGEACASLLLNLPFSPVHMEQGKRQDVLHAVLWCQSELTHSCADPSGASTHRVLPVNSVSTPFLLVPNTPFCTMGPRWHHCSSSVKKRQQIVTSVVDFLGFVGLSTCRQANEIEFDRPPWVTTRLGNGLLPAGPGCR